MTQLGERDAVDVDAHASEMFAEKPTDARADAEREPGVVREGTPPANERSREAHTGRARDRARPRGRADRRGGGDAAHRHRRREDDDGNAAPRADDSRRRRRRRQ